MTEGKREKAPNPDVPPSLEPGSNDGRTSGGPFPCPNCGAEALVLLGDTRHSTVLRCGACGEVTVRRREQE